MSTENNVTPITAAPDSKPAEKTRSKNSTDTYAAAGRTNLFLYNPEDLVLVSDPNHPLYDERVKLPIEPSMVQNILFHGVVEPVIVRKNPETGLMEVVDGRQRVKCTIEANKRLAAQGQDPIKIAAVVRQGEDISLMGVMVSANEQREADSPMGRARKMAALLQRGRTKKELAMLFRCTQQTVENQLALLDATAMVRKAAEDGSITVSNAYDLAKLDPEQQKTQLAKMLAATADQPKKKRGRAKKQREAAGRTSVRGKREILAYQAKWEADNVDPATAKVVLAVLGWILGGPHEPRTVKK